MAATDNGIFRQEFGKFAFGNGNTRLLM